MSAKITGMVWDMILEPGEKYVLLAYADHADHEGRNVRPSVTLIAKKTGHTVRGVQKKVSSLRAKGILVPMRYASGGRGHATEYRISFDNAQFWTKGEPNDTHSGKGEPNDTLCQERVNQTTPIQPLKGELFDIKGELGFTPTVKNLNLKKNQDPPIVPPGGPRGVLMEKSVLHGRRKKTYYPTDPEAQATLRMRVFDAAFEIWVRDKGLTMDLSHEWERFGSKALAKGYQYVDWRQAFMNWLTSPYQVRGPSTRQTSTTMDPETFAAEAAKWKGRI